jgi:phage repressor protein C with HTH and peptisase S24 domain
MLRHSEIWRAIDLLAQQHGLSASGLARKSGLDPTTFNKSKRTTRDGKQRWPSTESVARVLEATGATMADFVSLLGEGRSAASMARLPLLGFAQAGSAGFFDNAGYPSGAGWDEIPFPDLPDAHAYALEITGDSMEPVYRDGDIIIIGPETKPRRGDRVVLRTRDGEVMAKVLRRQTAKWYELKSFNPAHSDRTVPTEDVDWVARILWASQ